MSDALEMIAEQISHVLDEIAESQLTDVDDQQGEYAMFDGTEILPMEGSHPEGESVVIQFRNGARVRLKLDLVDAPDSRW